MQLSSDSQAGAWFVVGFLARVSPTRIAEEPSGSSWTAFSHLQDHLLIHRDPSYVALCGHLLGPFLWSFSLFPPAMLC